MDTKPLKEIVNELLSSLESLEAQSAAVLEFLKEKRGADKKLAPLLEQAAAASNVRYRAARLRMGHLFSELERQEEKAAQQSKEAEQAAQSKATAQAESTAAEDQSATPSKEKTAPAPAETADGTTGKTKPARPDAEPAQLNADKAEERASTAARPGTDGATPAKPSDKAASDQPTKDAA